MTGQVPQFGKWNSEIGDDIFSEEDMQTSPTADSLMEENDDYIMSENLAEPDQRSLLEACGFSSAPGSEKSKHEDIKTPLTADSGIDVVNFISDTDESRAACGDYSNDCEKRNIGGCHKTAPEESPCAFCKDTCKKYQKNIKKCWIPIKNEINTSTMAERVRSEGWLTEFKTGGNIKRSVGAEQILLEVIPQIVTINDIKTFERIVGPRIVQILQQSKMAKDHMHYAVNSDNIAQHKCRLQNYKKALETTLLLEDILEIKDNFLQCDIINLKEGEEIFRKCLHNPKCKDIVSLVINKAVEKAHLGSYLCIVSVLKKLSKDKSKRKIIKPLLRKLKTDQIVNQESNDSTKSVSVTLTGFTMPGFREHKQVDNVRCKLIFEEENEQSQFVYQALTTKSPDDINKTFVSLNVECEGTELGSVIIFLKSLDGNLISKLKDSKENHELEKVLQNLFNDVAVKSLLSQGKHKLIMEVNATESSKKNLHSCPDPDHNIDIVADNRSFLIEEIDTDLILKAFAKEMHFSDEDLKGNRYMIASRIIDVIIKKKLQKKFRKVLIENNMTYIHQRLITYERVYTADRACIRQNLLLKLPYIVKNIDLNQIRNIFIERGIFNQQLFCDLYERCGDDGEKAMVNFLIQILKSGSAAVLTFIDAMFSIQQDTLATELLNPQSNEAIYIKQDSDVADKWKDTVDNDVILTLCFDVDVKHTGVLNADSYFQRLHGLYRLPYATKQNLTPPPKRLQLTKKPGSNNKEAINPLKCVSFQLNLKENRNKRVLYDIGSYNGDPVKFDQDDKQNAREVANLSPFSDSSTYESILTPQTIDSGISDDQYMEGIVTSDSSSSHEEEISTACAAVAVNLKVAPQETYEDDIGYDEKYTPEVENLTRIADSSKKHEDFNKQSMTVSGISGYQYMEEKYTPEVENRTQNPDNSKHEDLNKPPITVSGLSGDQYMEVHHIKYGGGFHCNEKYTPEVEDLSPISDYSGHENIDTSPTIDFGFFDQCSEGKMSVAIDIGIDEYRVQFNLFIASIRKGLDFLSGFLNDEEKRFCGIQDQIRRIRIIWQQSTEEIKTYTGHMGQYANQQLLKIIKDFEECELDIKRLNARIKITDKCLFLEDKENYLHQAEHHYEENKQDLLKTESISNYYDRAFAAMFGCPLVPNVVLWGNQSAACISTVNPENWAQRKNLAFKQKMLEDIRKKQKSVYELSENIWHLNSLLHNFSKSLNVLLNETNCRSSIDRSTLSVCNSLSFLLDFRFLESLLELAILESIRAQLLQIQNILFTRENILHTAATYEEEWDPKMIHNIVH